MAVPIRNNFIAWKHKDSCEWKKWNISFQSNIYHTKNYLKDSDPYLHSFNNCSRLWKHLGGSPSEGCQVLPIFSTSFDKKIKTQLIVEPLQQSPVKNQLKRMIYSNTICEKVLYLHIPHCPFSYVIAYDMNRIYNMSEQRHRLRRFFKIFIYLHWGGS